MKDTFSNTPGKPHHPEPDALDAEFEQLLSPLPFEPVNKELAGPIIQKLKERRSTKPTRAEKIYLVVLAVLLPVTTVLLYRSLPAGDETQPDVGAGRVFASKGILMLIVSLVFVALMLFIIRFRKWKKAVKKRPE